MDEQESDFELTEPGFLVLLVKHEPVLRVYRGVLFRTGIWWTRRCRKPA